MPTALPNEFVLAGIFRILLALLAHEMELRKDLLKAKKAAKPKGAKKCRKAKVATEKREAVPARRKDPLRASIANSMSVAQAQNKSIETSKTYTSVKAKSCVEFAKEKSCTEFAKEKSCAEFAKEKSSAEFAKEKSSAEFAKEKSCAEFAKEKSCAEFAKAKSFAEFAKINNINEMSGDFSNTSSNVKAKPPADCLKMLSVKEFPPDIIELRSNMKTSSTELPQAGEYDSINAAGYPEPCYDKITQNTYGKRQRKAATRQLHTKSSKMMYEIKDSSDFDAKLEEAGNNLVIIDFHATWCGPCKMIAPKLEEMSKEFSNVVFLKVDVDECEDVATRYDIAAMPTFVFIRNKEKLESFAGANAEKLRDLLVRLK